MNGFCDEPAQPSPDVGKTFFVKKSCGCHGWNLHKHCFNLAVCFSPGGQKRHALQLPPLHTSTSSIIFESPHKFSRPFSTSLDCKYIWKLSSLSATAATVECNFSASLFPSGANSDRSLISSCFRGSHSWFHHWIRIRLWIPHVHCIMLTASSQTSSIEGACPGLILSLGTWNQVGQNVDTGSY